MSCMRHLGLSHGKPISTGEGISAGLTGNEKGYWKPFKNGV